MTKIKFCGLSRLCDIAVDEAPNMVADLPERNIIDLAQLHGNEDETYLKNLRLLTAKPIIQAFRIRSQKDILHAKESRADYILLDSGAGSGQTFDWTLLENINRPYFLAGGLGIDNIGAAMKRLNPYAVDVSSGIETDGVKDKSKMATFAALARAGGY